MSLTFDRLFKERCPLVAMVHLRALPGTPSSDASFSFVLEKAIEEATVYSDCGVDAIMIENMHDVPYIKGSVGPEITSGMAIACHEIRKESGVPCGVQVLAGANREAMAIAANSGLDFIRVEGFVFGHLADEGYMDACAGELLRYRRQIGAENIYILADIKKKHSAHALSSDVDIVETAKAAEFFHADGVIVTGSATAEMASLSELERVKDSVKIPTLIGSGMTSDNLDRFFPVADGLIVGSHFKTNGHWSGELEKSRVDRFMDHLRSLRTSTIAS